MSFSTENITKKFKCAFLSCNKFNINEATQDANTVKVTDNPYYLLNDTPAEGNMEK